jgi:hypothetical protein
MLGFDRTGNGLDNAISDQIDTMVRAGQIHASEGQLQLMLSIAGKDYSCTGSRT